MKKINLFDRNTDLPSYRRRPVSRGFNRGGGIPLFSGMTAVIFALFIATPSFAAPTELDKKTVASKAYVDTKQDIIETGLVDYHDAEENVDYTVPALVSYGTGTNNADGVLGNKIGILGSDQNWGGLYSYQFLDIEDDESAYLDNFVPTVRAVVKMLGGIDSSLTSIWVALGQISWTPFAWNNNVFPAAINAYSTTFDPTSTHVNGNWPYNQQRYLVRADTFANSLALKQNKIPAGTAGNVVTYSGTAGTVGSVATANAPTYNETTGVLENGTNIATIAAVDTRQKKMTCAGWDSETHTDEHCWLWSIE